MVLNYKDESLGKSLLVQGHKCLTGVCQTNVVEEVELEEGSRLWSDPANWPDGVLPQEGDDVIIESGWNMYLDLEETPILKSLEVNGRLTFLDNDTDITLNTYLLYVRAGELLIGSEDAPYSNKASIILHGSSNDETFVLSPTLEVYNKVFVTAGRVAFYGQPRTKTITRLIDSVYDGQTEAVVEPGLDIIEGDLLYFAPTALIHDAADYLTVASYDELTGELVLTEEFEHYHFGS